MPLWPEDSHRVPVIIGTTLNDDALGVYLTFGSEKISGLEYAAALTYYFGIGHASKVSQLYSNISSNFWALSTASTDYNLRCPSRSLARIWASHNVSSWLYTPSLGLRLMERMSTMCPPTCAHATDRIYHLCSIICSLLPKKLSSCPTKSWGFGRILPAISAPMPIIPAFSGPNMLVIPIFT